MKISSFEIIKYGNNHKSSDNHNRTNNGLPKRIIIEIGDNSFRGGMAKKTNN